MPPLYKDPAMLLLVAAFAATAFWAVLVLTERTALCTSERGDGRRASRSRNATPNCLNMVSGPHRPSNSLDGVGSIRDRNVVDFDGGRPAARRFVVTRTIQPVCDALAVMRKGWHRSVNVTAVQ